MKEIRLGNLIGPDARRDAIHIAIAPVVAAQHLLPGQEIGFVEAGNFERVGLVTKPTGIVDPYLKKGPIPGERFYMCLFPLTTTSLRHAWVHPDFPPEVVSAELEKREKSLVWLRDFGDEVGLKFNHLMEAARDCLDTGDFLTRGGEWEGLSTPDEFWDHYEIVTGLEAPKEKRGNFFNCSC